MFKRIVPFLVFLSFCAGIQNPIYALSPSYVDSVEIIEGEQLKVYVGEEIPLEAIAYPQGVDYAYMCWTVSEEGIVELECDESSKKLEPPTSKVSVKGLTKGIVQITVYADLQQPETEEYVVHDTIEIIVREKNQQKYEVYNNGVFTGITSVLEYDVPDEMDPDLYIRTDELYKLGFETEYLENGIILKGAVRKAELFLNEPAQIEKYCFETPLLERDGELWIFLDIIGKMFSSGYSGSLKEDVWRIYLAVELAMEPEILPGSVVMDSCTLSFLHNVNAMQIRNISDKAVENVVIYTAYYAKDGRFMGMDANNIYTIAKKSERTVFLPIRECFDEAGTVKIMMWCGENLPVLEEVIIPKNEQLQLTVTPPEKAEDRTRIYHDVPIDHPNYDAIYVCKYNFENLGITFGYHDATEFRPDECTPKDEFAYVLSRLLGNDFSQVDVDTSIADLTPGNWCWDEVGYLAGKGIMPLDNGYFYPGDMKLYDALSAFLKVLGVTDFTDENIIEKAEQHHLLEKVTAENIFVTRALNAQLLYNFVKEYLNK